MANTKPLASQVKYGSGDNTVGKVLKKSILSYSTLSDASAAAVTLPDDQVVFVENDGTEFEVNAGVLVLKSRNQRNIRNRAFSVADALDYEHLVTDKPDQGDPATWDWRPAIQAALDTGARRVIISRFGIYGVGSKLTQSTDNQVFDLRGSVIELRNSLWTESAIEISGNKSKSINGEITTSSIPRQKYLVRLTGIGSKIDNCVIYHSVYPNVYPFSDDDIKYDRGGVELVGEKSQAFNCEIYNFVGFGVVKKSPTQIVQKCTIHHNEVGSWVTYTGPVVGVFCDNVVEDNDGIGVLANNDGVHLAFYGNTLRGNGSHGAYLRCHSSMIAGNFVYNNFGNGIKVRDCDGSVVATNTIFNNNTGMYASSAELVLQLNEFGARGVTISGNTMKSTNEETTRSFSVGYSGSNKTLERLTFIGNIGSSFAVGGSSGLLCASNHASGQLVVGISTVLAPDEQKRFLVHGNYADSILATNRVADSDFIANVARNFTAGIGNTAVNRNNTLNLNNFYGQTERINRSFGKRYMLNKITFAGALTTGALFQQANSVASNSNINISLNSVYNLGSVALTYDDSQANSGNKNVMVGNIVESSTNAINNYGQGHTFIGNVNIGTGQVGFVGCSNSWLIGNSPKMTERAGTTGNQNI